MSLKLAVSKVAAARDERNWQLCAQVKRNWSKLEREREREREREFNCSEMK